MTDLDFAQFSSRLADLFPEADLSIAEADLWKKRIASYSFELCINSLDDHRINQRNKKRPDLGSFLGILKTRVRKVSNDPNPCLAFSEILRHQGIQGSTPHERIRNHYRKIWIKAHRLYFEPETMAFYRRLWSRQCKQWLVSEEASEEQADYLCESVFQMEEALV